LYITYQGVEKVVVDGEAGNDTFYVQSSSPNVELELVGGLGSDTFDVGGNGVDTPITVVSNSLNGHSGLIANLVDEAVGTYNNLPAQWVSANVSDNDSPGVMITQTSPILVFENATAPTGMIQSRYSIVLTQAPTENVRITAAPVALSEQEARAGGQNIMLNGSDTGVTLLFTAANWFLPQFITVTAVDDGLAEGTRFITIQHTVVQGAVPDDGGAYDGLAVAGVVAEVVDANSASVVVTPYDTGGNTPENDLLVAENPGTGPGQQGGSIPASDAYAVVLSKQPLGTVSYQTATDGQTKISSDGITWHSGANDPLTLTFTTTNWDTMQVVYVKGVDDNLKQGLHFSQVTQGVTSDAGDFLGLSASDVAKGIADAVNGDATGRFNATVVGSTVTVTGPAFQASISGAGTQGNQLGSQGAFTGDTTLTLTGTPTTGEIWKVTINGADFGYGVQAADLTASDPLAAIATQLASIINRGGLFDATASGESITVKAPDATPYTLTSTGAGSIVAVGTRSSGPNEYFSTYVFSVAAVDPAHPIELGASWVLSLNTGTSAQSAVSYTYIAGKHGETTQLAPLDVEVADDDAPGVLVIQPTGSTNLIEPSSFVVLGDGFVRQFLTQCPGGATTTCFLGDFGTSEVNGSSFHSTFDSAQDLDSGSWGKNTDPNILNSTTVAHITVHDTGSGNANYYKFDVTPDMVSSGPISVTLDMDHGYDPGDPILWLSKLTLLDHSGNVVAQGPGYSNPSVGAGGSTTWFDDFLQTSIGTAGEYYVEVGSWLLTTGLPVGVDYDLQVSVQNHLTAGFVFAPSPVQEDENANNGGPNGNDTSQSQNVDDATDWYTFFNALVGDGGTITSSTPYVQINGSGDGSFDLYSFTVSDSMLSPPASTTSVTDSHTAVGPFYSSVDLTLTGTVHAGDVWTLGIGNRNIVDDTSVNTGDTTLEAIANRIGSMLGSPYTYNVTTSSGNVVLHIANSAGFSLNGSTPNLSGLQQTASTAANTVTRTTTAANGSGTALTLSSAQVTVQTTAAGDIWTLTAGAYHSSPYTASSTDVNAVASALAGSLASALGVHGTATASGAVVTITETSAFTVTVSVAGSNPSGTASISGTPSPASQVPFVQWTSETVTIPTTSVHPGETWELTVGGTLLQEVATGTAKQLADALAGDMPTTGYTVNTANVTGGATLTISSSTPFTSTLIQIQPSGSLDVDPSTYVTHVVTVDATAGEAGQWTLTLGSDVVHATQGSGDATDAAASASVATAIQNAWAMSSYAADYVVTASGADLTITKRTTGGFTPAATFIPSATLTGASTTVEVVTVTTPAASTDKYHLVVAGTDSGELTGYTTAGALATALISFANGLTGFTAVSSSGNVAIASTSGPSFTVTFTLNGTDITSTSVAAGTGVRFTGTGSPVAGETWTAAGTGYPVSGTPSLGGVLDGLVGALGASAVREDSVVTLVGSADSSASITPAGTSIVVSGSETTHAVTVVGPVNANDTWTLLVAGTPVPVTASDTSTDDLADAIAAAISGSYSAVSVGSTIYVTGASAFTLSSGGVTRNPSAGGGTISGAPQLVWTQTVVLAPAGSPAIGLGDTWTIVVGGATYSARVTSTTSTPNPTFHITGGTTSADGQYASLAAALVAALALGGVQASVGTGGLTFTVTSADGTPLPVGQVGQSRVAATIGNPIADSNVHYETAVATLLGTVAPSIGEHWVLTVDGVPYTYPVQSGNSLDDVAAGLRAAYNGGTHDPHLVIGGTGDQITITDTSVGGVDPFSFSITRGSNSVKGVIDIDNANDVVSSVQVPVVLPWWQWIVALFPWAAPYFSVEDSLGFTAQPEFQLIGPDGHSVLATATCKLNIGATTAGAGNVNCSNSADPGSAQASDPFLEYTFTQPGTYTVKVGALVTWNGATTYLDVPNTFFANGFQGMQTGMHYSLFISLQNHDTNPNALSLVGKQITITEGAGAGQTATITAYDPSNGTYTLDQSWATSPDNGSRFQITESTSALPGYEPVTDSYQVVLTNDPGQGQTVYVDVTPQPTPTYNADQAFDPNSNYGQNNAVQVRVQTPRAHFLLTGVPTTGETWTILLNDRPFSVSVTTGESLAAIALALVGAVNASGAGYTASATGDDVLVTGSAFYAAFQITHDIAGATVTPTPSSGAAISFVGPPIVGETWTLTLDGTHPFSTTVVAGDTLASVVARIAQSILASSGYTWSLAGTVLNVVRTTGTSALAATVSVSAPTTGSIGVSTFFNEAVVTFPNVQPTDGETWSLTVDGFFEGLHTYSYVSHAGQSLGDVVAALGGLVSSNFSVGIGLNTLVIVDGFWFFSPTISVSGSITLGTTHAADGVSRAAAAGNGTSLTLTGTPKPGEVWTLTLDGNSYAAYSTDSSLSAIASQLAAEIPATFAQSQGRAYYSVSVSGATLTLHRLDQSTIGTASLAVTSFGGAGVTPTAPIGVTVALDGTVATGEVWTLTLDGNTYASQPYTSGGTAAIALQLYGLIPKTPAAALGGAYYAVSVSGSTLTIRRVDQASPVTASVSVSNPAKAQTVVVNPTKTSITYSGKALDGEVWAVTVDGKTYSYVSSASDSVQSIVGILAGAIHGAYTVSTSTTTTTATLTIQATAEDVLDAFGSVVLDTQETQGTATATASGSSAKITLPSASVVGVGETWTLTVDGKDYGYTVQLNDGIAQIVSGLVTAVTLSGLYHIDSDSTSITLRRVDGTTVAASLAISTLGAAGGGARGTSVAVDFEGQPTQGEVWTLNVDGGSYSFAVLYGDTLSDIAAGLGADLPLQTYRVSVIGRVLTVTRIDDNPLSAGVAISPDSRGGAVVTQQLVFTGGLTGNWDQAQTVTVEALDNSFVDGHDALVFPPMTGRTDQVLGPVIIDGGLGVNPEPFLTHPLMLPGETNLPLADGTITCPAGMPTCVGTTSGGQAYFTDVNATSVSAATGQRPGFDPRMNDFAYTVEFLNGTAAQETLDVDHISSDLLSVANATSPFTVALTGGDYRFLGTPDQSMSPGTLPTRTLAFTDPNIEWTQATVALSGTPRVGDMWILTLAGIEFTHIVATSDTLDAIAVLFAALTTSAGYTVQVTGATLSIALPSTLPFSVGFEIVGSTPGESVTGAAAVSGMATLSPTTASMTTGSRTTSSLSDGNLQWTAADISFNGLPNIGDTWTLTLGSSSYSYTVDASDDVASLVALKLAALAEAGGWDVEARVGILGDSQLLVSDGGAAFGIGFEIVAAAGKSVLGSVSVTGTPTDTSGRFTMAAFQILGAADTTWELTLNGVTYEYDATSDDIQAVAPGLAQFIGSAFAPVVGGTQVFFKTGWDVAPNGSQLVPSVGDQYYVAPLNLNTRVDESTQVDTLLVDDSNSPSNEVGTITEGSVTGLSMGGDTTIAGQTIAGGISYSNIETLDVQLGSGDDHLTVSSTGDGNTFVSTGAGNDTVDVVTTVGHTSISTGAGNDTVDVHNNQSILQLGGLLTVDTGAGSDTVTVDNSAAANDTDTTITGSTITGTASLVVGEEQTIVVQASGGNATLLLPGAQVESSIVLDYLHDDAVSLAGKLQHAYGFTDIDVTETETSTTHTFTIGFVGAHAGIDYGQIAWAGVWTLTTPATGSFTLLDPNYGQATLTGPVDAATLTTALQSIYRTTSDVTATATGTQGVFTVTFTGTHAGLDFSELTIDALPAVQSVTLLTARVDSSAEVRAATVRDGTTTPDRDVVQTIDVGTATGSFVLHYVLPDSQGILQDVATGAIPVGASAEDLFTALNAVLNPNNINPALPFTDNVMVEKHGTTFTITYQGSMRTMRIAYVDTSAIHGSIDVETRASGIDYANVETLNLNLGSGDDVVNVQGTTATTNLSTAAGDDRIYVSSGANVGLNDHPSFIAGTLDNLLGTLNIDAGTGNQTLMISDEASTVGVASALMTRDVNAARLVNPTLSPTAELYLTGFAVGGISLEAAPTGSFGGGIDIWMGSGDDHVTVNATHFRSSVNEVTELNTGLGNDHATVNVQDGADGSFVLDAQGPDENVLNLVNSVQTGDYNTPADSVGIVLTGPTAATLTPDQFVVDALLGQIGIMVSPEPGTVATVSLTKRAVWQSTLGASRTVMLGAAAFDHADPAHDVSATVNGVAVALSDMQINTTTGTVTFTSPTLPVGALVLIEIVRHLTEQFALPQANGRDDDTVDASGSTLPITVFGGQGNDTITAGVGGDVIFGDRGRILWFQPGTPPPTIPQSGLTVQQLADLESTAVAVAGGGGPANVGMTRLWGLAVTVDPSIGGSDTINVPQGNDVVFGGQGNDTINLGAGTNLVFGDSGYVDWAVSQDGTRTEIANAASILPAVGGDDTITTGSGSNIVVGGAGNDTIQLGAIGTNIVLGDNGSISTTPFDGPEFHGLPIVLATIQTVADSVGGSDTITTGSGDQIVFGGAAGDTITTGSGSNIVFGDDGRLDWGSAGGQPVVLDAVSTSESIGDADTITMGSGPNIVVGGAGGDTIGGGSDTNIVLGDSGEIDGVAGNPDPFGTLPITVGMVRTTAPGIGGNDTITIGSGSAIVMGGTGADSITTGTNTSFVFGDDGYITWT
ncbi:MAG TPA: hypothetical protein VMS63_01865, partial [Gaiellaceae bacterium]|nr:hypothetical protein [Gaiellaceae bacterium]